MKIDLELVKRAGAGDKYAFEQIYAQIYTDLYRMSLYILGDSEAAKDAVSETVLDAYKGIGKLKDETSFESWIVTILSRKCKRMMRRKYDVFSIFNPSTVSINDDDDKNAENAGVTGHCGSGMEIGGADFDEMMDVAEAVKILNEKERMIVSLCIIQGYKSAEVGEILSMRPGSVRSSLNRALAKMRNYLSGKED